MCPSCHQKRTLLTGITPGLSHHDSHPVPCGHSHPSLSSFPWPESDVLSVFQFEIDLGGIVFVQLTRGLRTEKQLSTTHVTSATCVTDIAMHAETDFTAKTLTWSCRDVTHDKSYGPFVVPFAGTATDMDSVAINVRGLGAAIDDLRIEGR